MAWMSRAFGGQVPWATLAAWAFFPAIFIIQYAARGLDDNTLTGWSVVFDLNAALGVLMSIAFGSGLAYLLSRYEVTRPREVFVLGYVLALSFMDQPEVIIDSARYFMQAKYLSTYGILAFLRDWGHGLGAWTDMPLIPMIYGLVFKIAGEARVAIVLLTSAMFAASAALLLCIYRMLWPAQDSGGASSAGLMLLAIPFLYTQAPLMLVDIPAMFFLVLSVHAVLAALEKGGTHRCLWAALALALAATSKYSLWLMLSVHAVLLAVYLPGTKPFEALKRAGLIASAFGVLAALYYWQFHEVMRAQIALLMHYQKPGLERWTEGHLSTYLFQTHPALSLAALASVVVAIARRDIRYLVILWLPALVLVMGIRRARYVIPMLPMLALSAAYGLSAMSNTRLRRQIVYGALVSAFLIARLGYMPFLETNSLANLKSAGEMLDTLSGSRVQVLAMPQRGEINPSIAVPLLDYYTQKQITYKHLLVPLMSEEEIAVSAFRFTWLYADPEYYKPLSVRLDDEGLVLPQEELLAVITPEEVAAFNGAAQDYGLIRKYNITEYLYKYRPFVYIYERQLY